MGNNLRPLAKCGNGQRNCFTDVQYAAELAFSDTMASLKWTKPQASRELRRSLNTIKAWCAGDTTPDPFAILAREEFARVWSVHFQERMLAIVGRRAA